MVVNNIFKSVRKGIENNLIGKRMDILSRKAFITERFKKIYHQVPQIWGRAPGRVDLMGSHTDYNMGYVLTMTIDLDTWIAACPRSDRKVMINSMNLDGGGEFGLDKIDHDAAWPWTNYVRGVASVLAEEGCALSGFNGLVQSTIPFSSGLSSSASIEMAASIIFQRVSGFQLDPVRMALLGQKAENSFVGVNCGILDQYSSAMGQPGCSILLDSRKLTSQLMPITEGIRVVICDTRLKRNLIGSEYSERRAQCEEGVGILRQYYPGIQALRDISREQFECHRDVLPAVVAKRCQFIIEENQRVLDLASSLTCGNRNELRLLYNASYTGARDLFEIGTPAMDLMMQAMMDSPGIIGARQAGAGFGGCMVSLVESDQASLYMENVKENYHRKANIEPAVFVVEASAGAGLLDFA
jgi:galactokinase